MLTKAQLNYIIAVKQLTGSEASQKYICEYLGVKKPTASAALKALEEGGYIEKYDNGGTNEYRLTEKSIAVTKGIEKERYEFMTLFGDFLGMDYELCKREYENICGAFSAEFTAELEKARLNGYKRNDDFDVKSITGEGVYELPFRVVHTDDGAPSMGDRGFVHPARLLFFSGRQEIELESKQIYYKDKDERVIKGKLSRLHYFDGAGWISAEEREENKWILPIEQICCQNDSFGRLSIGTIKIRAAATTKRMPESEAEIAFNFKMMKKTEQNA